MFDVWVDFARRKITLLDGGLKVTLHSSFVLICPSLSIYCSGVF